MAYTTATQVRNEAWFEGNTNVLESLVDKMLLQAHGVVQSYLSAAYNVTDFAGALFTGSQAEGMLARAEELIGAWFLLIKQYWLEGIGTEADWYKKKAEGENLLKSLLDPKRPLRLLNVNGVEFTRVSASPSGWLYASGVVVDWNKFSVDETF